MTTGRWSALVRFAVLVTWGGCARAWMDLDTGDGDVGASFLAGVVTVLVPALVGPAVRTQTRRSAEGAYAALGVDERLLIDEALGSGEPRGPVVLRYVQRDLARQRLYDAAPQTWVTVVLGAVLLGLVWVPMVRADRHPPALMVVSLLVTVALALLPWGSRGGPRLCDEERRRLKAVSKAPVTP